MAFDPNKIRNVAVFGHQGCGKTSLVESLYFADNKDAKGSVEAGTTISDYSKDEKKRLSSISTSIVPVYVGDYKINLLDVPGNDDFVGEAIAANFVIKGAILVIDAQARVQVGTLKTFKRLRKAGIPFMIYVNKMDKGYENYEEILDEIATKLSKNCVPFTLPLGHANNFDGFINCVDLKARKYTGKECVDDVIHEDKKAKVFELHNRICEAVATTNDELLEKFFAGEPLTNEEIHKGLREGVLAGDLYPIIFGSAINNIGVHTLLSMFVDYLPSPVDLKPYVGKDDAGKEATRKTLLSEPFSGYIFKTLVDPYLGQINYMKVISGVLKVGQEVYCPNLNTTVRVSAISEPKGKDLKTLDEAGAGDIVALTKLADVETSFTLCDKDNHVEFKAIPFPSAVYFKAISTNDKKDDEKLGSALAKIVKEEKTLELRRNVETKQLLLGGISDSHINFVLQKIKANYGIEINVDEPKVCYRETITREASGSGRYIKQSGGSGFYGVVEMKFMPSEGENEFTEEIFGGAVPKNYFPSVEKGFFEACNQGLLAGFPVVKCKAVLVDGKYHPVDSNELAFKMASILAFKDAYMKAGPTILEPILMIKIHIQTEYLGDILNDLNSRRGRVQNIIDKEDESVVEVLLPESESLDYVTKLKVLTQGSGFFVREFYAYEEVPSFLREKVIKDNSLLK